MPLFEQPSLVSQMKKVVVYSKDGCHLCENVISELEKLKAFMHFDLTTQDISKNSELFERYKNIIPVVSIDGKIKLAGGAVSSVRDLRQALMRAIISQ
jgi:glutaredoxin